MRFDTEPEELDLTCPLPTDGYCRVGYARRPTLPPPVADTPEDLARRANAAIAQVAPLLPAYPGEAALAIRLVSAQVAAMDCAGVPGTP